MLLFNHVYSVIKVIKLRFKEEFARDVDVEQLLLDKYPAVGIWYNNMSIQAPITQV